MRRFLLVIGAAVCLAGCESSDSREVLDDIPMLDVAGEDAADAVAADEGPADATGDARDAGEEDTGPVTLSLITFNTGTTERYSHDSDPDGYNNDLRDIESDLFGNNLGWLNAREYIRAIVDTLQPDILNFQELFYDPGCESICSELNGTETWTTVCDPDEGVFACSVWTGADTSELTVRAIVGPDYDIACAPNHNDNCIAVRKGVATLNIVETATLVGGAWIGGLDGMPPANGCTRGARVATGVIDLADGTEIALVDVHTVAGGTQENQDCRKAQFEQVFVDRGDGKPAAFGVHNIVMGDMNIDPFRWKYDDSIDYWNSMVGDGKPFHYISSSGADATPTHTLGTLMLGSIDHVISDNLDGECSVLGVSDGLALTLFPDTFFFDHRPVFCTVEYISEQSVRANRESNTSR